MIYRPVHASGGKSVQPSIKKVFSLITATDKKVLRLELSLSFLDFDG